MGQTRFPKEPEHKPENYCPEHKEIQLEDSSLLQTKLLGKPWCEQHFYRQINLQSARKGKSWAAVYFNGLKSINVEDNLWCYEPLCLHDSLICSQHIHIFIRWDALSQAIPLGNIKKKKATHNNPKMAHRPRKHQSLPYCVQLVTDLSPFLLRTARAKRVKEVKRDQLLFFKSYKMSTNQGVTSTWSYLKGSVLHSLSDELVSLSNISEVVTTSQVSNSCQRSTMPLD